MQSVILLHGAIGSKTQLTHLAKELEPFYDVHLFNFSGHGGEACYHDEFSIELFASQLLNYLDTHDLEKASLFGYSMGGYVAVYFTRYYPQRVEKVVTLATKFHWDKEIAAKEIQMLDPLIINEKVPAFATQLRERHGGDNWELLLKKTAELLLSLGRNNKLTEGDYKAIKAPALILRGDRDAMVTLGETLTVFKNLQSGQLGILPGTSHPIEKVNLQRLVFELKQFLH